MIYIPILVLIGIIILSIAVGALVTAKICANRMQDASDNAALYKAQALSYKDELEGLRERMDHVNMLLKEYQLEKGDK